MYEISVIIPFYKSEKYIHDCLTSVICSTMFEQCEVLLINDGSIDHSGEIVQEISDHYDNIHVYDYDNSGLSAARNRGMANATGKYIFFLDSDDYLLPDYLSGLYKEAESTKSDIVFAGFSKVNEEGNLKREVIRPVLQMPLVVNGCRYLHARMDLGDWHNEACCALYRRQFLESCHLKFDETIRLYEDILFTTTVLLYAKRVRAVPLYGYMYRYHKDSLVQGGVKTEDITAGIKVLEHFLYLYQRLDHDRQFALGRVVYEQLSMILYYIGQVRPERKSEYYRILKAPPVLKILKDSRKTPKERIKYIIFRYCMRSYYLLVKKKVSDKDV